MIAFRRADVDPNRFVKSIDASEVSALIGAVLAWTSNVGGSTVPVGIGGGFAATTLRGKIGGAGLGRSGGRVMRGGGNGVSRQRFGGGLIGFKGSGDRGKTGGGGVEDVGWPNASKKRRIRS